MRIDKCELSFNLYSRIMKKNSSVCITLSALSFTIITSCTPLYPEGLSEAEWNSLSPEERAELNIREQQLEATRSN